MVRVGSFQMDLRMYWLYEVTTPALVSQKLIFWASIYATRHLSTWAAAGLHTGNWRKRCALTDAVSGLKAKIDAVQEENSLLRRANESLQRRPEYYENSNSPPSADSLEWRRQKRERARQRKEGVGSKEGKKPGGRAGRPGTSRKHSPPEDGEALRLDPQLKIEPFSPNPYRDVS